MSVTRMFMPRDAAALAVGANEIAGKLTNILATTGQSVEVVRNGSRGMMWLEPLLEVEQAGIRYGFGPLLPGDIDDLVDRGLFSDPKEIVHPKALGPVEELDWMRRQTRLTFARCGITDPVSISDYQDHDGFRGIARAIALPPHAIIEEVKTSGLRGRGGAGFPTGIKWQTVLKTSAPQKYIICNADEGDSGSFADRMLMEGDPFCLIEGMVIAGIAVGATKGFIYLRSEYPDAKIVLEEAIINARDAGFLGTSIAGSGYAFDIEVRMGAGSYVCGEETALLESLEGKRGQVRAKPPLPAHEGLFGQPTIINNVLTLAAIPFILSNGAKTYADQGFGKSRGTMPIQLAGNIKHGGLFEVGFGISLGELVNDIGNGTATGRPVRAVQVGGPLGAYFPPELFDTPFDYESFAARDGLIGHGGIVVFDEMVDMAEQARFAFEFCAIESCGKCTPCRIGAVRGEETLTHIIAGNKIDENLTLIQDLCETMKFGSLCALGGFTPYPVLSAIRYFPQDFGVQDFCEQDPGTKEATTANGSKS